MGIIGPFLIVRRSYMNTGRLRRDDTPGRGKTREIVGGPHSPQSNRHGTPVCYSVPEIAWQTKYCRLRHRQRVMRAGPRSSRAENCALTCVSHTAFGHLLRTTAVVRNRDEAAHGLRFGCGVRRRAFDSSRVSSRANGRSRRAPCMCVRARAFCFFHVVPVLSFFSPV